ncbi:hypothetical protein PR048_009437 [Dryococelus australis]|uniref:Uncharacterized protein n=1 Tax=Dryococelus australis TaxID=614101 RepID=A0ABQ9HZW0_9NEOP|nr:hypothetical protein PR048_009437 [Dryococelus australis]
MLYHGREIRWSSKALIKNKFPKATFVHFSYHRLNHVVNDLNDVRKKTVPNVLMLSETQWTQKYKYICVFYENFISIVAALQHLYVESNSHTRQTAYQILCAIQTSTFIVCLVIVSNRAAVLESITQALQGIQVDLLKVKCRVKECEFTAHKAGLDLTMPRLAAQQTMRRNLSENVEEYFRQSVFIPYLDSIIASLESCFSDYNHHIHSLLQLHPMQLVSLKKNYFESLVNTIQEVYHIVNFEAESSMWGN